MTLTAATPQAALPRPPYEVRSNPVGVTCTATVLALDGDWNLDALESECVASVTRAIRSDEQFAFWSIVPEKRDVRVHVRIFHHRKDRNIQASFALVGCGQCPAMTPPAVELYSREYLDSVGLPKPDTGPAHVLSKIRNELFGVSNRTTLWEVLRAGVPVGYQAEWVADPPPERRDLILPFDWPKGTTTSLGVLRAVTRLPRDGREHRADIFSLSTLSSNRDPLLDRANVVHEGVIGQARCVALGGEWDSPQNHKNLRDAKLGEVYVHSASSGQLPPVSAECALLRKEAAEQKR